MRAVFKAAEKMAPAVILLDEIDSLLMARSDASNTDPNPNPNPNPNP